MTGKGEERGEEREDDVHQRAMGRNRSLYRVSSRSAPKKKYNKYQQLYARGISLQAAVQLLLAVELSAPQSFQ